ncbi:LysE family transporter [Candidatus Woesearchaeota archaeon]|nr:LysE family transporter [Candidatus Woesearchaeota archaeon]
MVYIESIILGTSLAAIPGPIFFEVMRRSLLRGFWCGAFLAIGEFLANATVLLLTFFGIGSFLLNPALRATFFVLGSAVFFWIGTVAWKTKGTTVSVKISNRNSVYSGFLLAVSSPLTIAVWVSIGGAYLAQYDVPATALLNIILIALGAMLFFLGIAGVMQLTKARVSTLVITRLSKAVGLLLLGYGCYFLLQFVLLFL